MSDIGVTLADNGSSSELEMLSGRKNIALMSAVFGTRTGNVDLQYQHPNDAVNWFTLARIVNTDSPLLSKIVELPGAGKVRINHNGTGGTGNLTANLTVRASNWGK